MMNAAVRPIAKQIVNAVSLDFQRIILSPWATVGAALRGRPFHDKCPLRTTGGHGEPPLQLHCSSTKLAQMFETCQREIAIRLFD